jgi:hypothetical protein
LKGSLVAECGIGRSRAQERDLIGLIGYAGEVGIAINAVGNPFEAAASHKIVDRGGSEIELIKGLLSCDQAILGFGEFAQSVPCKGAAYRSHVKNISFLM